MSDMTEDKNTRSGSRSPMGGPMGAGMAVTQKAKDFKGTLVKLIRYCRKYMPAIIIAVVFATAGSILRVIGPKYISNMAEIIGDGLKDGVDVNAVTKIGIFLAVCYALSAILTYVQGYMMATVTANVSRKLRSGITHKINRLPLSYFDRVSYGKVLSRVTNDADTIGMTLNQSLGVLVTCVTTLLGILFMMFYTNWIMAITVLVASLLGMCLTGFIMSKSQKHFVEQQVSLGDVNGHIEEIYTNHSVVKAYNAGNDAKKTFEKGNRRLFSSGWKSQFMSGIMMPFMGFIGNFSYVAVCIVGAVLSMKDIIKFEVTIAFMLYARMIVQPLSQMAQAAQSLQSTAAASERVFELLDEKELPDESQKQPVLENINGNVDFCNVYFGYVEGKTVIHDFSASIKAGQKIAIVGPTGAGKTTIVNLLMRFYEIDDGEILIDGTPISSVTRENIHDQFAMVLQDTWLFEGTIKENIVYSKGGVSDEQVIQACKAVGLDHYIRTLPMGYDTVLGDKEGLSQGQKQLVTIARAMIQNAPMLILDEATSSVDTRTEILIQEAMDKLMIGRTSFIIAHRLSTIKNADMILVMKDGDIIERGTHCDLLAAGDFYAELYNSQFETA